MKDAESQASRGHVDEARWEPVLYGRDAEDALAVAKLIAHAVTTPHPCWSPESDNAEARAVSEASLGSGAAGVALFLREAARTFPNDGFDEAADECLERAAATLTNIPMGPGLYSGVAGIAYVAALEQDADIRHVDVFLSSIGGESAASLPYDLISGIVGIGIYLLSRLPADGARQGIERIVQGLEKRSVVRPGGITWDTPKEHATARVPDPERGYYDMGPAHGIPGILAFLVKAIEPDVCATDAERMLRGALSWMLPHVQDPEIPFWMREDHRGPCARPAWCYGDLPVSNLLRSCSRVLGDSGLGALADTLALSAVTRVQVEHVTDSCLCHGNAGLALQYQRHFSSTGDHRFRDAAKTWYLRTLAVHEPSRGVGGYEAWIPFADKPGGQWYGEAGFLMGSAGVGLSLLAATAQRQPRWLSLLLLD